MKSVSSSHALQRIMLKLKQLPNRLIQLLKDKTASLIYSAKMQKQAVPLSLHKDTARELEQHLRQQLQEPSQQRASLSAEDEELILHIQQQTLRHNLNNVTRTQAYWSIYETHPELHWALLAHMVSRNGGWSMTDLRGELLPKLLNEELIEPLFLFLERANGLIFQDAYPQLLLYAASQRMRTNKLYLLSHLHVSSFMGPVWQQFWQHRDSTLLTISLIVNEQNYIEQRIVQNPIYRTAVLDQFIFKTQSMLQLNQVYFPYGYEEAIEGVKSSYLPRLAGLVLEDFTNLEERIEFGKKLYAILYGQPTVNKGVLAFAKQTAHTGSRADYWPQLFTTIQKAPPELPFKERLIGDQLIAGSEPYFSPSLAQAWADRSMADIELGDWYVNLQAFMHIEPITVPFSFDMTSEACFALNKIELAIIAEQSVQITNV